MSGFLNPLWLWALPAAALPLILHLVARRQPPTVAFPAVRYLQQVTRDHQRRLKLQHWLLLLVRTLLVLALILAAAGPTVARDGLASHAPAALVLMLDNSPSSGAVSGGTPVLDRLRAAARTVLDKATPEDAVWLVTSDGLARRAPVERLRAAVGFAPMPSEIRLDLGVALAQAGDLLANADRPGEVVVLSDLQRSALSAVRLPVPVLVGMPDLVPPPNLGVATLDPGPQPWSPGENRVRVRLAGDSGRTSPLSVAARHPPGSPRGWPAWAQRPRCSCLPAPRGGGPSRRSSIPTNSGRTIAAEPSCGCCRWRGRSGIRRTCTSPRRRRPSSKGGGSSRGAR